MQANSVSFSSKTGAVVSAYRKDNAYIDVSVQIDGKETDSFVFTIDDFAGLHRISRKVFTAVGEESPRTEDVRRFCESIHSLMTTNQVLVDLNAK